MNITDDLPLVLSDWLRDNASLDIVTGDNMLREANANLRRMFLSSEEARSLSVSEICKTLNVYMNAIDSQVIGRGTNGMLLYIWHDEASGSLCASCISEYHLPALPFACQIDTSASIEYVIAGFLDSTYLEGIPASDFRLIEPGEDPDPNILPVSFTLCVFTAILPKCARLERI